MQARPKLDPALKALVFQLQLLESTTLSSHWFQIDSTCVPPTTREGKRLDRLMVDHFLRNGMHDVAKELASEVGGRCKLTLA